MVTVEREQRRGEAAVLRRIWRLHFWVGLLAAPALIVLACTGLTILYSQPLDLWLDRDLKVVAATNAPVSLDSQIAAAREHVGPRMDLAAVTPPQAPDRSTQVDFLPAEDSGVGSATSPRSSSTPTAGSTSGSARNSTDWSAGPTSCTGFSATMGRPSRCRQSDISSRRPRIRKRRYGWGSATSSLR